MEHSDDVLICAALFDASDKMFRFALSALVLALKQERMGGFTADGKQIEPPVAHLVRPLLDAFIAAHQETAEGVNLTQRQTDAVHLAYREHLSLLRQDLLSGIREFEI